MPHGSLRFLVILALFLAPISASAADTTPDTSLAPLKFLVGEWKGADAEGKPHKIAFTLGSGGTTLTETLTPPDRAKPRAAASPLMQPNCCNR